MKPPLGNYTNCKVSLQSAMHICFLIVAIVLLNSCTSTYQEIESNPPKKIVKPLNSFFREKPLPLSRADSSRLSKISLEYYLQASELQLNEKYAEAILVYQRVMRFDSSAAVLYSIATCYDKLSQIDLALEFTERSLKRDSLFIQSIELLAELKIKQERYKEAIDIYEHLLTLTPKNTDVIFTLAGLYELTNPQKAQEYFATIIEISGYETEIVKRYGNLLIRLGEEEKYIALMKRHYEIHPDNAHARALLVEAYSIFSHYEKAFAIIDTCSRSALDEELEEYYQTLALDMIVQDDTVQYKSLVNDKLQKLTRFSTMSWKVLISLALLADYHHLDSLSDIFHKRAERLTDSTMMENAIGLGYELLRNRKTYVAEKFLQRYATIFSYSSRFPFLLAMIALEKDSFQIAIDYLRSAIHIDSKDADAWAELGSAYTRINNFKQSDSCFEQALSIDKENALYNNNYAYSLSERNVSLQKAMMMSKIAIEQFPGNPSYLDTYAWIQYKLGNLASALDYAQKAIEFSETPNALLYAHIGEIYKAGNDRDNAIKFMEQALKIDPENKEYIQSLKAMQD